MRREDADVDRVPGASGHTLCHFQFGVGDVIDAGEAVGTVEAVTPRVTKIRDLNGNL